MQRRFPERPRAAPHAAPVRAVRSWGRRALAAGVALALLLGVSGGSAQAPRDARVEALLARMTLEEKVGEMTQLTLQSISRSPATDSTPLVLDTAKLENVLVRHGVGSILNVFDVAYTPRQWQELIRTLQRATERKRLKIPVIYGIDAVHGHNYMVGATLFPQNLGMTATWNPELVRRAGEVTAIETRASGIPWNFAPVLDIGRQPLWPRFYETFGEDPHLAKVMGAAAVRGMQGDDVGSPLRVAATGKHFLGYGVPRSGMDRTPAWITDRELYEYHVPTFRAAIEAGVRTVMVNSGDVNGVPVHASRELLTRLLREELGFTGVAVSDWRDIIRLHTVHRVAPTPKDAVRMAVLAGIDMSMVPYDLSFRDHLLELVREGAVPEERVDESVRRILKLKYDLGLFENRYPDPRLLRRIATPEHRAVSREAAEESITLLKNDGGILPLARTARVLVTGPGADDVPVLFGGWTYTWQGTNARMYPKGIPTLLQALRSEVGADRVTYVPGATYDQEVDVAAAALAARQADVAVVALAERPQAETPGNIEDLQISPAQLRLVQAIHATGTPVVLVLVEGRPRIVREAADSARAVVMAYQPGPFGAESVANVLFGDVNPSGRLPFTYPRHPNALLHYDHAHSEAAGADGPGGSFDPQWTFGHGLSYTTFAYGGLRVANPRPGEYGKLVVSVEVANTGSRAGKEVVQLYVRDLYASVAPPVRRLRAFQKIELQPGERRTVTFEVPVQELAFIGLDGRPVVEPGDFEVMVGGLVQRFTVAGTS